jgi:hypothetical protein
MIFQNNKGQNHKDVALTNRRNLEFLRRLCLFAAIQIPGTVLSKQPVMFLEQFRLTLFVAEALTTFATRAVGLSLPFKREIF